MERERVKERWRYYSRVGHNLLAPRLCIYYRTRDREGMREMGREKEIEREGGR